MVGVLSTLQFFLKWIAGTDVYAPTTNHLHADITETTKISRITLGLDHHDLSAVETSKR